MFIFLGICLLSSVVYIPGRSCSKLEGSYSNTEEANAYLDGIIEKTIEQHKSELEPYHPKDANYTFEHKYLIVNVRGEATMSNMSITGLTTIHREGDCERVTKDGISKLSGNLGMGVLEFDSKLSVKIMGLGPAVKLSGEIGYAMIHLEASRDIEAGSQATIDKLEIYDIKGIDLKVTGFKLGVINVIASKLVEGATKVLKGKIREGFEKILKERLEEKMKDSVFPID